MKRIVLTSIIVAASALAACDDNSNSNKTTTVTYSGALVNGVDNSPIAGAHICFVNPSGIPCVDTAADGSYSIDLPTKTKVEVEVTKDGFLGIRSNFITREADAQISAQMFQPAAIKAAFDLAQLPYDETKSGMLVRVYDPATGQTQGLAGVSISLEPADGAGPFYLNGLTLDASAQATTTVGNALFSKLDAGTYKVKFTSATNDCKGTYLWKDSSNNVQAIVKDGFATYIYADCPTKQ